MLVADGENTNDLTGDCLVVRGDPVDTGDCCCTPGDDDKNIDDDSPHAVFTGEIHDEDPANDIPGSDFTPYDDRPSSVSSVFVAAAAIDDSNASDCDPETAAMLGYPPDPT